MGGGVRPPKDFIVLDFDATLITAHSEKQRAAPNYKHGFGFHPSVSATPPSRRWRRSCGPATPGPELPSTMWARSGALITSQGLDRSGVVPRCCSRTLEYGTIAALEFGTTPPPDNYRHLAKCARPVWIREKTRLSAGYPLAAGASSSKKSVAGGRQGRVPNRWPRVQGRVGRPGRLRRVRP